MKKQINFYLSEQSFITWFLLLPIFFLAIHFGIIIAHIFTGFHFTIPFIVRLTGMISAIWTLLGTTLWIYKR